MKSSRIDEIKNEEYERLKMKFRINSGAFKLDVLINCAGIIKAGDLDSVDPKDHDEMMWVNTRAANSLIAKLKNQLAEAKGCVVNVSCIKGSRPQPGLMSYCMSKAGLESLTKSWAIDLGAKGVRVNCISSSFLLTNFLRR
jgi:NAD(P)-dependent dehydrogenase (short-subunit alcohol dehydrogenase family)